eukprot:Rmarinus@m.25719
MRAVVQRVLRASVTDTATGDVHEIGKGVVVLVGITHGDTERDADYIVRKSLSMRLWDSQDGKRWSSSVVDNNYEILIVSQFTLHGSLRKARPSFHQSMGGDEAKTLFQYVVEAARQQHKGERIKEGFFGAMMELSLVNDGPVTLTMDTEEEGPRAKEKGQSGNNGEKEEIRKQ